MLFILGINIDSYGQDKVISLWKNQIPNEIISTSYQELNTYKNGEIESSSQVSKPTLSLFLPKKTNLMEHQY